MPGPFSLCSSGIGGLSWPNIGRQNKPFRDRDSNVGCDGFGVFIRDPSQRFAATLASVSDHGHAINPKDVALALFAVVDSAHHNPFSSTTSFSACLIELAHAFASSGLITR